jgi:hypothetical protein
MEARPLNLARPEVPEELAAVVRKMMAKDPAQRYQTPAEVAQALGVFARQGAKGGASPKSPDLSVGAAEAQPARPLVPAAEERKAVETAVAAPAVWDTLTEESITSAEPRKSRTVRKRRPPAEKPSKRMWFIGGGIAAALLLLGLLAAVVFKLWTRDGIIVLEIDQPGAEVLVDGGKITVCVPGDNKPVEIQAKPGQHKLRISKAGFVAVTEDIELTAGKSRPIKVKLVPATVAQGGALEKVEGALAERGEGRASASFFNGEDLAGWEGLAGYWDVKPGHWDVKDVAIVGRPPPGRPAHTFLVSRKKYRDFDLKFEVRRLDGVGNSGVQFRSQLKDPNKYTVVGPQVEIDSINFAFPPGSLVTEPNLDPLQVKPSPDALAELRKTYSDDGFNAFHVRCVGKHVTVRVNGVTTVDGDFLSLPEEGVIAWQLHGRMTPKEVTFRNIRFTDLSAAGKELSPAKADAQPAPGAEPDDKGFVPLFNGKDRSDWHVDGGVTGQWTVEDGDIVGRSPISATAATC